MFMSLLAVSDLCLGYEGKAVVRDISFTVNEGDYLCIIGENGSGKTTLIKGLLGLMSKYSGEILFSDDLEQSHIGYLSQHFKHKKDFPASVREVVMSGFLSRRRFGFGYSKAQYVEAHSVMEQVGIIELEKKIFSDLSGGQQQRVLLARALCATRRLILLDEPTSALDPIVTADFYSLLRKLSQDGVGVVMVSHDINSALRHATHILCLDDNSSFFGTTHEFVHSDQGRKFILSDCPCDDCTIIHNRGGIENA